MAANKYEEIAQAAIRLFEKKGYHATSVQDIADEVGLQKGSLYHYITSKEELLMKITFQSISNFNKRLERILNSNVTSRQMLVQAIENHIAYVATNVEMTTVLLREAFSLGEQQHTVIKDATDRYLDLWMRILDQGVASGEFKPFDTRLTALAILGSCNWLYRWYQPEGKMTHEQIAQLFAELYLDGILTSHV